MLLTRTDTSASVELPDDLYWEDEHASRLAQSVEPSLTGAALIQEAVRQYVPMTLRAWADEASWVPRAIVDTLAAWADVPGLAMTLSRLGVTHDVLWRASDGAIERDPVMFWVADPGQGEAEPAYRVTLRLLRIL